jgi:hypothetical protein
MGYEIDNSGNPDILIRSNMLLKRSSSGLCEELFLKNLEVHQQELRKATPLMPITSTVHHDMHPVLNPLHSSIIDQR